MLRTVLRVFNQLTKPPERYLFRGSLTQGSWRHHTHCIQVYRSISIRSSVSLAMNLRDVVKTLDSIAPCSMAEDWDNVGLLTEPSHPNPTTHILLTNDLTEPVLTEALELKEGGSNVGLIISYHPPIFRPFKRLTQSSAKERIIIKSLESRIAIYSPHTAHDALWGGVNDWILSGISTSKDDTITPLTIKQVANNDGSILKVGGARSREECVKIVELLKANVSSAECYISKEETLGNIEISNIHCRIGKEALTKVVPVVTDLLKEFDVSVSAAEGKVPVPGGGRLLAFSQSMSIRQLVDRVKAHLGLKHVRLALPDRGTVEDKISTLAVCAGSGASVLRGAPAQVFLTGEMSHHDILDAVSGGVACILCEHSNTERGFLKVFKSMLEDKLNPDIKVLISQTDKDPVNIV